jgi:hypothetical protein
MAITKSLPQPDVAAQPAGPIRDRHRQHHPDPHVDTLALRSPLVGRKISILATASLSSTGPQLVVIDPPSGQPRPRGRRRQAADEGVPARMLHAIAACIPTQTLTAATPVTVPEGNSRTAPIDGRSVHLSRAEGVTKDQMRGLLKVGAGQAGTRNGGGRQLPAAGLR